MQCIVLLRKNEDTLPALKDVKAKVEELNDPASGRMLPGVQIEPYYDRTDLIHVTTETVTENLLVGIVLVTVILFMFLSNVRTALIVAINIPLALLFAFSVLFLRGKSANLLSIGAVDFGIIVDSSVIMVENIYRHLAARRTRRAAAQGTHPAGDARDRPRPAVLDAHHGVRLHSAVHHARARRAAVRPDGPDLRLLPGRGPVLAMTLTPVLCLFFFKNLKPVRDNFLVRFLKSRYLWQLERLSEVSLDDRVW